MQYTGTLSALNQPRFSPSTDTHSTRCSHSPTTGYIQQWWWWFVEDGNISMLQQHALCALNPCAHIWLPLIMPRSGTYCGVKAWTNSPTSANRIQASSRTEHIAYVQSTHTHKPSNATSLQLSPHNLTYWSKISLISYLAAQRGKQLQFLPLCSRC